jgi:antitoxin (DNA-binding transcriptional repressor) of toxin-antitoxin stability system
MTDIQAINDFAAILAAAEEGESVIVTKNGVPIGTFIPDRTPIGVRIQEVMRKYPVDPDFADDIEAAMREMRAQPDRVTEWPTD